MSRGFKFTLYIILFLATFNFTTPLSCGTYIVSDLGGSSELGPYAVVFFGLGNASSFGLGHHLSKRFGKSQLAFTSLAFFVITIFLSGIASTFLVFIFFRFLSGVAGGSLGYASGALINENTTEKEKITALGYSALIMSLTPTLGGAFGAWIAYDFTWQWVFYSQIPLFLIVTVILYHYKKPFLKTKSEPFDWTGYIFYILMLMSGTIAIALGQQLDWFRSPLICSLIGIFIASFLFFCIWELKTEEYYFLKISICRALLFSTSILCMLTIYSAYYGILTLLSLWLHLEVSYTPIWIAIILLTMAFSSLLLFLLFRFWEKKVISFKIIAAAVLTLSFGAFYSTTFNSEINFTRLLIAHTITGFGLSFTMFPLFLLTIRSLPSEDIDHGTAIFQSIRLIAGGLGAIIYSTIWLRRKVFYHERLGESLTPYSELTSETLKQTAFYGPTGTKAHLILDKALNTQSAALALADCFYLIGWIMLGLFFILAIYIYIEGNATRKLLNEDLNLQ